MVAHGDGSQTLAWVRGKADRFMEMRRLMGWGGGVLWLMAMGH